MEPVDEEDCIMTIEDFGDCIKDGFFIDYDGVGCLAYENLKSNINVYPSEWKDLDKKDFTHVVWFNK